MGVVQAINSKGDPFHESDIHTLENISRFIAYALYHARLYDELSTLKGLHKHQAPQKSALPVRNILPAIVE